MNNSNAAAKRRRAGIQPTTPPMPSQNQTPNTGVTTNTQQPQNGYTLPQVIAIIDTRLITLEKFMNETKESADLSIPNYNSSRLQTSSTGVNETTANSKDEGDSSSVFIDSTEFTDFVDDINQRFQLFADEINGLKEIVLKLQGFTMDVNNMLLATLSKNNEAIPNITWDMENRNSEKSQETTEKDEQTFVLESQKPEDLDKTANSSKSTAASEKSKKR